jgi:hypothetical protein
MIIVDEQRTYQYLVTLHPHLVTLHPHLVTLHPHLVTLHPHLVTLFSIHNRIFKVLANKKYCYTAKVFSSLRRKYVFPIVVGVLE